MGSQYLQSTQKVLLPLSKNHVCALSITFLSALSSSDFSFSDSVRSEDAGRLRLFSNSNSSRSDFSISTIDIPRSVMATVCLHMVLACESYSKPGAMILPKVPVVFVTTFEHVLVRCPQSYDHVEVQRELQQCQVQDDHGSLPCTENGGEE